MMWIFLNTLKGFWFQKNTLILHAVLILGLGIVWRMTQPASRSIDEIQRIGWVWSMVTWGVLWEVSFCVSLHISDLLDQYLLHVRSLMPWLLGIWAGYWLFFLVPLLIVLHFIACIPVKGDVVFLGSGLLSALALNIHSMASREYRWPAMMTCIPLMVPIVIVCVHPVPIIQPFLPSWLSVNGWILLGLWGILMPIQFWASHALLKKSLSFPVLLLK